MFLVACRIFCLLIGFVLPINASFANDKVIVFVPGILGSKLAVDGKPVWGEGTNNEPELVFEPGHDVVATPLDKFMIDWLITHERVVYGDLIKDINSSLSAPQRFLPFAYDWRGPNADSAKLLHAFLCEASIKGDVVLVAHSMGGLVVKHWIADMRDVPCQNNAEISIDSIVFAATPHQGSPQAVMSLISEVILDPKFNWLVAEGINDVGYSFDSLYELLPPDQDCYGQNAGHVQPTALYFGPGGDANVADLFEAETYENLGILDRFPALQDEADPKAYLQTKLARAHEAICKLANFPMPGDLEDRVYYLAGFGEIENGQRPRDTIRQLEFYSAGSEIGVEASFGPDHIGLKAIKGVGDGTVPLTIALNGNPEFDLDLKAHIVPIRANHQSILNSSQFKGLVTYLLNGPSADATIADAGTLAAIGNYANRQSLVALTDRQTLVNEVTQSLAWTTFDAPVRYAFAKETKNPILFEAAGADAQLGPVYQAWAMQNAAYYYAQKNLGADALRASVSAEIFASNLSPADQLKILPSIYNTRGAVQLFVGNLADAEAAYRQALAIDANASIAKLGLERVAALTAAP